MTEEEILKLPRAERLDRLAFVFQKYPSPISVATRMAQFVVESGAGESPLFKASNNGFGIKASAPWKGDKILWNSKEKSGYQHSFLESTTVLRKALRIMLDFLSLVTTVRTPCINKRLKQPLIRKKLKDSQARMQATLIMQASLSKLSKNIN